MEAFILRGNKEVTITHYRKGADDADLALDRISDHVPDGSLGSADANI